MKRIFICGILLFTSLYAVAQNGSAGNKVDAYIAQEMRETHIVGLSLAVIKNGKVIKASGYGMANIEDRAKATAQTAYKIASVSKQFLAAGILLLQQDGKLHITDPVSRYIQQTPASWKNITLQRLLNHSAGLPLDIPAFDPFKIQTDSALIASLFKKPLLFAPGDSLSYSNAGYFVIADVIRKVSGMPWDVFISKRIFEPLHMTATRTTSATALINDRARGYIVKSGMITNAEDWLAVRPSGAFLSTVLDMAKWDAALYGTPILTTDSKKQLWAPVRFNNGGALSYALGWNITPFKGHNRVFHDGGLPGFLTYFERFLDDGLTVVVLCNTEGNGIDPGKISLKIAGFYNSALQ